MVPVVSRAQPAELVSTLGAGHVHATLVLLDLDLALGAGLGVELDPYCAVIITTLDLVQPSLE